MKRDKEESPGHCLRLDGRRGTHRQTDALEEEN